MPSTAHLKPWGPNNPPPRSPGRPRKRPLTEANEDLMRAPAPPEVVAALRKLGLQNGATCADVMSLCLFREGMKGNVAAIKELRESIEGKATQRIELLSHEDRNVEITVQFEKAVAGTKNVDRVIDVVAENASEDGSKAALVAAIANDDEEKPLDKDGGKD